MPRTVTSRLESTTSIAAWLWLAAAGAAVAETSVKPKTVEQVLPLVTRYCGACHAVPHPDVQIKSNWPALVRIMVEIMQTRTGRAQISEEQMHDIIAFYYGSAPEQLPKLPAMPEVAASRAFTASVIGARSRLPFVTHVNAGQVTGDEVELLVSDGEARQVLLLTPHRGAWKELRLAEVEVPAHTQIVDIDGDGDNDVLVADLGQLPPLDAKVGKLLLLRQVAPRRFSREVLLEGLGRVSDARAIDLDGDLDLDIAVAVFGGGDKGEVFWLENEAKANAPAQYRRHDLLSLSGAVSIVPADLNNDSRMDLVTLLAQEHEMIVAFMNLGEGRFEHDTLARAPHPMYGSTSLAAVDLDRDGDVDLLFTNGDAFDAQTDPKPYHGVQWLENKGGLKFDYHDVGRFYGAATAAAGDLDGDGDLDIVAGSWVSYWNEPGRHAVVWFENDGRQAFTPQGLIDRPAGIASLQLADVNGDGAMDIVAGAIRMDLLLTGMGSSYRASRLFPAGDSAEHPRVLVLERQRKR